MGAATYDSIAVEFAANDKDAVAHAYRFDEESPSERGDDARLDLAATNKRNFTHEREVRL